MGLLYLYLLLTFIVLECHTVVARLFPDVRKACSTFICVPSKRREIVEDNSVTFKYDVTSTRVLDTSRVVPVFTVVF